jgi:AmmeMemoRadiSam system protein B
MRVRPPAVSGHFYPADPHALTAAVDACLATAVRPDRRTTAPRAIVVPHAGYVYSGSVAASAYAQVAGAPFDRVVLLGPSHHVALRGMAVPTVDAFTTPLGRIPIDTAARTQALDVPHVVADDLPHALEHSLEVQLPFLQRVLGPFTLLPVVVGDATAAEVAALLDLVWPPGATSTLVVVSTDLSHYRPDAEAQALDARTAAAIVAGDTAAIRGVDACGARPLRGLLTVARDRQLHVEQLDLRNSGHTAGDRSSVVGYGAFAVR